jgi:hypothetical protein
LATERSLLRASTLVALCLLSRAALADPTAEDMAAARALGTEGVTLAASGDCKGAIPKLQAAEKLFHAPTTADRLGECQISVGQLVAGTELLNRVVREPLAANAPTAFIDAQQRAKTALAAALPKIAQLKIHVDGAPADKVTVTVDDEKVPSVLFDSNRPTDPGTHQVKATAQGFLDAAQSVQIAEGASASVTLALKPNPNAAAVVPAPVPAPGPAPGPAPTTPPDSAAHGSSKVLPIVLLAAGGVGIAVGSVFGVMALGTKSSLDSACTSKVCPGSSQSDINSLGTQSTISTIGFGVGIVGVALGVYFLVASGGSSEAQPAAASTLAPGLQVHPWLGLGSAGLGGTFQ